MRLLIVEDEASAARRLIRLIGAARPTANLVHIESAEGAVDYLSDAVFDGIFLDLNLAGSNGFDVLRAAGDTRVIVVSAHVDRSLEAFDHGVLDFVAKPVVAARLAKALDRLDAQASGVRRATLIVRSGGRVDIVDCEHIIRLQSADDYVELVMSDGRRLLHDAGLAALENRLPPNFIRTHRSHIVNAAMVVSVQSTDAGPVALLTHNEIAPISRRRAVDVRRRLLAARGSV
jgi:two-component system, LytTR family, response regulator LytT